MHSKAKGEKKDGLDLKIFFLMNSYNYFHQREQDQSFITLDWNYSKESLRIIIIEQQNMKLIEPMLQISLQIVQQFHPVFLSNSFLPTVNLYVFVYEVPSSAPDTLYLPAGSSGRWLLVGFGSALGDIDKVGLKIR